MGITRHGSERHLVVRLLWLGRLWRHLAGGVPAVAVAPGRVVLGGEFVEHRREALEAPRVESLLVLAVGRPGLLRCGSHLVWRDALAREVLRLTEIALALDVGAGFVGVEDVLPGSEQLQRLWARVSTPSLPSLRLSRRPSGPPWGVRG